MERNKIKRILTSAIGLMICGVGVGMFLYSGLGVDPASVFQTGLANVFNVDYGFASASMNVVILVIVFFIDKKYINISSVLAIFLIGYTAQFTSEILGNFDILSSSIIIRYILLLLGLTIMSFGIPVYISADLGVGAVDLVSELISNKSKISYRALRVSIDLTFVAVGYFLGGAVGIGTIIIAVLTGPLVQFFRPLVNKILKVAQEEK